MRIPQASNLDLGFQVQPQSPRCDFARWSSNLDLRSLLQPETERCDFARWSSNLVLRRHVQPEPKRCDFAGWSSNLDLGLQFLQNLQQVTLPSTLVNLKLQHVLVNCL